MPMFFQADGWIVFPGSSEATPWPSSYKLVRSKGCYTHLGSLLSATHIRILPSGIVSDRFSVPLTPFRPLTPSRPPFGIFLNTRGSVRDSTTGTTNGVSCSSDSGNRPTLIVGSCGELQSKGRTISARIGGRSRLPRADLVGIASVRRSQVQSHGLSP